MEPIQLTAPNYCICFDFATLLECRAPGKRHNAHFDARLDGILRLEKNYDGSLLEKTHEMVALRCSSDRAGIGCGPPRLCLPNHAKWLCRTAARCHRAAA